MSHCQARASASVNPTQASAAARSGPLQPRISGLTGLLSDLDIGIFFDIWNSTFGLFIRFRGTRAKKPGSPWFAHAGHCIRDNEWEGMAARSWDSLSHPARVN
jgi:hypothetical protein